MPYLVFFSYRRVDDRNQILSGVRKLLEEKLQTLLDESVEVFQDVVDIEPGDDFPRELAEALSQAEIIVPVITRNFFNSRHCRQEIDRFLEKEAEGRTDTVVPIVLYRFKDYHVESEDPRIATVASRQDLDWSFLLSKTTVDDPEVVGSVVQLAQKLAGRLENLLGDGDGARTPTVPGPEEKAWMGRSFSTLLRDVPEIWPPIARGLVLDPTTVAGERAGAIEAYDARRLCLDRCVERVAREFEKEGLAAKLFEAAYLAMLAAHRGIGLEVQSIDDRFVLPERCCASIELDEARRRGRGPEFEERTDTEGQVRGRGAIVDAAFDAIVANAESTMTPARVVKEAVWMKMRAEEEPLPAGFEALVARELDNEAFAREVGDYSPPLLHLVTGRKHFSREGVEAFRA